MRYHFFLHYGWFFQNLGKEGRRTFMHTTVATSSTSMTIVLRRDWYEKNYAKEGE